MAKDRYSLAGPRPLLLDTLKASKAGSQNAKLNPPFARSLPKMWICKYAAANALLSLLSSSNICSTDAASDIDVGLLESTVDLTTPFVAGIEVGRVSSDPIKEASGLASSRVNAQILYTHNDRGGEPRIFAIRSDGTHVATVTLNSALHVDYEDIAVGKGPEPDTSYVYVGDIGNNFYKEEPRDNIVIYRLKEPLIDVNADKRSFPLSMNAKVDALTLTYPGRAHDAETLLLDPFDSRFYVITKRDGNNFIYRTTQVWGAGDASQTLQLVGRMQTADDASGGDISVDGTEILIRNRDNIFYFTRDDPSSSDLAIVLAHPGEMLPYEPEPKGESVAFATDGQGCFTLSEAKLHSSVPLLYYVRNNEGNKKPTEVPTSNPTKSPSSVGTPNTNTPTSVPSPLARVIDAKVMRRRIWLYLEGDVDPIQASMADNYVLYDRKKGQVAALSKAQYLPPKTQSSAPRILLTVSLYNKNALLDVGVSRDIIDASMVEADVQPGFASIASVLSGRKAELVQPDGDAYSLQILNLGLINYVENHAKNHSTLTISRTSKEPYESALVGSVSPSPGGDGIIKIDSIRIERTITSLLDPEHFVIGPLSSSAKETLEQRSNGTITDALL